MKMKKSYIYHFFCIFLSLLIYILCTSTPCEATPRNSSNIKCIESEREALIKIKHMLKENVDLKSWVGEDCCTWRGVGCDNVTSNIILLEAFANKNTPCNMIPRVGCPKVSFSEGEHDTILSALIELKHLTYLDLSGTYLQGRLTQFIGSMTHLRYLDLSLNSIYGDVPPQLGNLTNLEVLDLSNNFDLTIKSLEWASSLSNLQFLNLSLTHLSKTVNLNQLPSVSHLSLSGFVDYDNISYVLSQSFVNNSTILSSLKYLDLSNNFLESPLTPNLANLSSLVFLDLSHNLFDGLIPSWLKKIKSLRALNVEYNSFSHVEGGIWGFLNNSCYIEHLDLSYNNFQGEILQHNVTISKCTNYELNFLDLSYNQISDNVSLTHLDKLLKLSYLDLSNNQITGTLPFFIGQLRLLKHLDLSSNPLQGTVSPMHVDNLSKLSFFNITNTSLSLNFASDWIPPFQLETFIARSCKIVNPPNWLRTQTSVIELDLSNTSMSGEPKDWISNMSNLQGLNLSYNFLTGPLPQEFSSQNLQYLDLHNNGFSGTFPAWLGYLENLDYMDLSLNNFSGSIPHFIGQNCSLRTLLLNDNNLKGTIPPSLGNCSHLEIINLSSNNLSGHIPPWTNDDLPNLKILLLQKNQLGESSAKDKDDILDNEANGTIPDSLCNLTTLYFLDLQKNKFRGVIPDCWQNSWLLIINLSSNKLSGVIPCSFGQLQFLQYLHLNNNELNGEIPSCLSAAGELNILDVGENKLIGSIPSWFKGENFSNLNILRLSHNHLNGTIPNELCSLSFLRVLDLSSNQLTGNILPCLGNLTGINMPPENTVDISGIYSVDDDTYEDSKVIEFTNENSVIETIAGVAREYDDAILKLFTTIDLSGNHFEGTIPEELTNLSGLIALLLDRNHLKGSIPEKIGDMKALETLDLSWNNLYGRIPPSLGNIDSLNHINFSYNNLSGPIPINRHIDTLDDASVYVGNIYLCGDTLPKKCSSHIETPTAPGFQDEDEVEDKNEKLWFYLVVMLGFITGFWGFIGTLWLKKSWRYVLFRFVEDVYDWLYVGIVLKISKLKK